MLKQRGSSIPTRKGLKKFLSGNMENEKDINFKNKNIGRAVPKIIPKE